MSAHKFHPSVLREYDIRGIVGKTLKPVDALAVGRGFGTFLKRSGARTVAIGYDGRHSSPELEAAVVEGLVSTGMLVKRIGLGPTPMSYFAIYHLGVDASVMITGSHNPPEYNGIKMATKHSPVYGSMIQEIGALATSGDLERGNGRAESVDISDAYVERLLKDYRPGRDLNIAWDAGNGATGTMLKRMVAKLPGTHHLLFTDIDGNFPNHHPDPTVPENLVDLIAKVKEKSCDIGIGFDGDGDRIGAIDNEARIIFGDQLLAIYASEVLAENPGATVIADVKSSDTLFAEIERLGGKPLMYKTGHSLLKAKMIELKAPLAGEMSGHINFGDRFYGYDDALYCGIRLASLVARSQQTLAQMADRLPKVFNTPETRFQVDEVRKFKIVDEVKARLAAKPDSQVNDIDGVRVKTPDGWWLLRASNTQDVLVARAESLSEEGLGRLKEQIIEQLRRSGVAAPPGF